MNLVTYLGPWAENRKSYRRAAVLWFGGMGSLALAGMALGPALPTAVVFAWHTVLVLGGMRVASQLNERRLEAALVAQARRP